MKHLRRIVWYIATRLLVACLVLGLMVVAFYYAMNATNIYIVLKDGMARRAQVVMQQEEETELTKYFQNSFLEWDSALTITRQGQSPYRDYDIRGIDHRLSMDFAWIWPWDATVRVDITESIPSIDGRIKGSRAEEAVAAGGADAVYPPSWQSAKYRAVLTKENGQWRIKSLTLIENLAE
ncbi:MAG: hypothetical protein E7316_04975 [Clostridiales bacterium]|nr:hypothetical protein [Clostridiales bacterium]